MSLLTHFTRKFISNNIKRQIPNRNNTCSLLLIRLLNYSSIEYDEKRNPAPLFFNAEVQSLLRNLTRVDLSKVFRKRRLGEKRIQDPEYRFMTDEELQEEMQKAKARADVLLKIPPVLPVRKPISRVISADPALQGLETCDMIFTDITFGIQDKNRLIVVRKPDGTLTNVEGATRNRINQIYFPMAGRAIKPPKLFEGTYLESLLERQEFEFILDSACIQYEPDDSEYQRVVSVTYQYINDNNGFEKLRSTRHFGALVFFLTWNKNIDNLLQELIENGHCDEGGKLVALFSKLHSITFESDGDVKTIEDYIKKCSLKRSALELALQAYKDLAKQRQNLESGIQAAHGLV